MWTKKNEKNFYFKWEKIWKVEKPNLFLFFGLFFRNHIGILENIKRRNYPLPVYRFFFEILHLFLPIFFVDIPGWFFKKIQKNSEKWSLFPHLGAVFWKNKSRSRTKTTPFFVILVFVKNKHTRVKKCWHLYYGTYLMLLHVC